MPRRYPKYAIYAGIGLTAMLLGASLSGLTFANRFFNQPELASSSSTIAPATESAVLPLLNLPPADRTSKLTEIAQGSRSIDQARARLILASEAIAQDHGGQALPWLDNLEQDYPVLAAEILAKRAQALTAAGKAADAEKTWQTLVDRHPQDPSTAEALFQLGKTNPQYWDQALSQFPSHPRSVEIALTRLEKTPNQPQLLMQVARHGIYTDSIIPVLERLKKEYAAQLTPEDWEAIAFAYWEKGFYGSAGGAYAKAPPTALNLYRTARGAELGERYNDAIAGYQRLLQAFPNSEEAGEALIKLAGIVPKPQDAVPYLDQAIAQFPDQAAEALYIKSEVLEALNSRDSSLQATQSILSQHSQSDIAARVRWRQAEANAKKGDVNAAWEWAQQLVKENPDSEYAPEAAFWVGKWATALGKPQEAQQAYEFVLANYPESYYAWRSATFLGWEVGDFTSVRQKLPQVLAPKQHPELLSGSEATKELYRLGQTQAAWTRWQTEYRDRVLPSVSDQFTDGLIRLGVGDNLDGIFMLSNLSFREKPDDKAQVKAIKQKLGYWQALYPFPFMDLIAQEAAAQQLNPMLVTALIRQESRFEPKIKSVVGATGLMQVMPETAEWVAKQVNLKNYKIDDPADNVKMGTWYLKYTHQEYDDNSLFAVASYNAGPGAVADWIDRFGFSDPDQFIEQIPFPETKGYVTSVFENYWNYLRIYNPEVSQKLAQYSAEHVPLAKAKQ